jgi:hypothetical protein
VASIPLADNGFGVSPPFGLLFIFDAAVFHPLVDSFNIVNCFIGGVGGRYVEEAVVVVEDEILISGDRPTIG